MFPEGRLLDFLIVGAVALIVVGPKDLPLLMRKVGQFMGRVRAMAAEFRASFDELARQSELEALRKEVEALRVARPVDYAMQSTGLKGALSDINAEVDAAGHDLHAAIAAPEASPASPEPAPPTEPKADAP
ncbi:MAG: twin-arginine translocase subunit TatB [Caulobacteraceae bacterium]|nr:twin-arginine translocase subunit TatB [Caulobacteraceae bacterium]